MQLIDNRHVRKFWEHYGIRDKHYLSANIARVFDVIWASTYNKLHELQIENIRFDIIAQLNIG